MSIMVLLQFSAEHSSERILKIGQFLAKIWKRIWSLVFLTHDVANYSFSYKCYRKK